MKEPISAKAPNARERQKTSVMQWQSRCTWISPLRDGACDTPDGGEVTKYACTVYAYSSALAKVIHIGKHDQTFNQKRFHKDVGCLLLVGGPATGQHL